VPSADVEDLGGLGVEPAEEQRGHPVVEQLLEPAGQAGRQRARRELVVAPGGLGVEQRAGVLTHALEVGARTDQVGALVGQDVVGHGRGLR
jgi:hypothetical protein